MVNDFGYLSFGRLSLRLERCHIHRGHMLSCTPKITLHFFKSKASAWERCLVCAPHSQQQSCFQGPHVAIPSRKVAEIQAKYLLLRGSSYPPAHKKGPKSFFKPLGYSRLHRVALQLLHGLWRLFPASPCQSTLT